MKEVLKEIKNILTLVWYKFRKALEWIDSKIPEGSGNNSDEKYISWTECKEKDLNGTCSNLHEVYSDKAYMFMKDAVFHNDRSNSLKSTEKER